MLVSVHDRSRHHDLRRMLFGRGCMVIGRGGGCALTLDCAEAPFLLSRKHATIANHDGKLVLTDEGSTNGTFVRRAVDPEDALERLSAAQWTLREGDVVAFGGPLFIVADSRCPDGIIANPFVYSYTSYTSTTPTSPQTSSSSCASGGQSPPNKRYKASAEETEDEDEKASQHLSCPICHDLLAGALALPCGHLFCGGCMGAWLSASRGQGDTLACPQCRRPALGMPARCRSLDAYIESLMSARPTALRAWRSRRDAWESIADAVTASWARAGRFGVASPGPRNTQG